jgi:hypothetical protein
MSGVPNWIDTLSSRQTSELIAEGIKRQSTTYSDPEVEASDVLRIKNWVNVLLGSDDVHPSTTNRRSPFWLHLLSQRRENGIEQWTDHRSIRLPVSRNGEPRPWVIRLISEQSENITSPLHLTTPLSQYYVAESFRGVCKHLTDSSSRFEPHIETSAYLHDFLNHVFVHYHSVEVCHALEAWELIFGK